MLIWFTIFIQIIGYMYLTLRNMAELNIYFPVILGLDNSDGWETHTSVVGRCLFFIPTVFIIAPYLKAVWMFDYRS